ncbi:MAG TPA: hypothetical protein VMV09_09490 [Candidatus Saccharimonadales bacterium]|nr:hypothetical protein [Candidatus Saccharimonadales bacterium]
MVLDLMLSSRQLRQHVASGKIVLGINHQMTDFATNRKKDLDLVLARPGLDPGHASGSFDQLVSKYGIVLNAEETALLEQLPKLALASLGAVAVALEAKACMTAHVKSLPRLYDELNSSHLCVHGASRQALAIGFVQVNNSEEFLSPVTNNFKLAGATRKWNRHRQPADTMRVLAKVSEIPRRSASSEVGFDGLGVVVLDARNDGSPVTLVTGPPAPPPGDTFDYASMITRMANEYDTTFNRI